MLRFTRVAAVFQLTVMIACSIHAQDDSTIIDRLITEATAMEPLVQSQPARDFLGAVENLPRLPAPRIAFVDKATRTKLSQSEFDALDDSAKAPFERREYGDDFYYYTAYGTPLAFVRALDLVGQAGLTTLDGKRVIDFGFGSIGQLKLMASLGATAHGIDVEPLFEIVYSDPSDTGAVVRSDIAGDGENGSVYLHFGSFPSDERILASLGGEFDVFFSKNTLKRGYIHPEREVDPRMLVNLGVEDSVFVKRVYDLLKPGGYFMIYNLHPKRSTPEDEKYIPWSDGRCPFDRGLLERTGFNVIALDVDDTKFAHQMAAALGWTEQMNLETDLFGMYTLLQRRSQ